MGYHFWMPIKGYNISLQLKWLSNQDSFADIILWFCKI